MAVEIERKFTVKADIWRPTTPGIAYSQGYISQSARGIVRVRIAGDKGYLTVKGAAQGISRLEYEYEIPIGDAEEMLQTFCRERIIKTRYQEICDGVTWEIDVFAGENRGLIVAEVELESADQAILLPEWVDQDVSNDPRYYNNNLVIWPFSIW
jgi:CYTH domain-containing protein